MAVIECATCLIFICICLPGASAIMPSYIPVTSGSFDRYSLIEYCFSLGLSYSEILSFLLLVHGIRIRVTSDQGRGQGGPGVPVTPPPPFASLF